MNRAIACSHAWFGAAAGTIAPSLPRAAGDHLVICNVRPHCLDGMHALIKLR